MPTSTHLPPPVMIDSTELLRWVTHMLCWTCAMYFSAAASSENDQGSINSGTLQNEIFGPNPGSACASRLEPRQACPKGRHRSGNSTAHRTKRGNGEREFLNHPQDTESSRASRHSLH